MNFRCWGGPERFSLWSPSRPSAFPCMFCPHDHALVLVTWCYIASVSLVMCSSSLFLAQFLGVEATTNFCRRVIFEAPPNKQHNLLPSVLTFRQHACPEVKHHPHVRFKCCIRRLESLTNIQNIIDYLINSCKSYIIVECKGPWYHVKMNTMLMFSYTSFF